MYFKARRVFFCQGQYAQIANYRRVHSRGLRVFYEFGKGVNFGVAGKRVDRNVNPCSRLMCKLRGAFQMIKIEILRSGSHSVALPPQINRVAAKSNRRLKAFKITRR